jgi:hypothetical protein
MLSNQERAKKPIEEDETRRKLIISKALKAWVKD